MLITRIISALVMLLVVLVALFQFPTWGWALFTAGISLVAIWEWSRFCGLTPNATRAYLFLTVLLIGVVFVLQLGGHQAALRALAKIAFAIAAVFWLLIVPLWLSRLWRVKSASLMAFVGWVVVLPMWLAMLALREVSPWVLLSFAAIAWVADIAAYVFGKTLGKHKLAPDISPGKTIEGAMGGIVGVALYFYLWFHHAAVGQGWARDLATGGAWLFGFFMLVALVSIIGDLFESWMKRGVGLKDSSKLLPGHGGVLDRIDALTSTLPLAALYVLLTKA